jgi:uncharacterized membrane protein YccC
MKPIDWHDAVFSLKTFGAALLALWIAFSLDLQQPAWSMLTVLIVSQPIAGMVAAKSLYRVAGTVAGTVMAVVLVATLAEAPPFFLLALALWSGLCTGLSILLRDAPASYGAMLSGYTAAIIGVPAAQAPLTVFDTAVARCTEISLGIACATIVSQVVFPQSAGKALRGAIDLTVEAVFAFAADTLRAEEEGVKGLADRRALVADAVGLDNLRVFAGYDTPAMRAASHGAAALQRHVLACVSVLVSIHDRIRLAQRVAPQLGPSLRPLLSRAADLLDPRTPGRAGRGDLIALRRDIAAARPDLASMRADGRAVLQRNLLDRVDDVLVLRARILRLRDGVFSGRRLGPSVRVRSVRYREPLLALVGGAIATGSVLVASAIWIATAWPSGGSAVTFAAVISAIMAQLDDPAAAATNFLGMTVLSVILAALALYGVLPLVDDFAGLAAMLALFYIPFGMLMPLPRIGTTLVPLGLNFTALIGITNTSPPSDFAAFVNGALGLLGGIAIGIAMFRLLRPLGLAWTLRRIHAAILRDLARLADRGVPAHRDRFEGQMYDRINALMARLDPGKPDERALLQGALALLRIGLNLLGLRASVPALAEPARQAVQAALDLLARHFAGLAGGGRDPLSSTPGTRALAALREAGEGRPVERCLATLSAIRVTLDTHADFFRTERIGEPEPVAAGAAP